MATEEDEIVNFQLVSTYVPLLLILIRSMLLLTVAQFVASPLDTHGALLIVLAAVVYFDAHLFRHNKLNQACGFLCPVALCILQSRVNRSADDCDVTYMQVVLWSVDMVWAISCTSYVAIVCYKGYFVVRVVYAAAVWAACAIVHALTSCVPLDIYHQMLRTVLYYVTCTIFYFFRQSSTLVDRNSYQLSVLHIFLHIFFVQHYVLFGSIIIAGLVFGAAYYVQITGHALYPKSMVVHARPIETDADIMRELRAAQKCSETAA